VSSAAAPLLEARNLQKSYGPLRAVDGVSFALEAGEFLTVFGPNGAGTTTLLGLLGGGLKPTSGEVLLGGEVIDPAETEWRTRIGVLSHQSFLYGHLSAAENLRFYAALYGVDGADLIPESLARVGLADRADSHVRTFSRGMRQRLALARTLLHDPELVLLDEPYTGLDAHAAAVLREVLGALKDGRRTVVMVTHNLAEGLELADRVAIQVRGRFVHLGTAERARELDFARFYVQSVEAVG
jgi:heme exporter protein A